MDASYYSAILRAESFWHGPVLFGLLSMILALLCAAIICKGMRPVRFNHFYHDEAASAGAVDFVLTIPIVGFVAMLAVQLGMIAQAGLVVHYAAYSAARSARVHYFESSRYLRIFGANYFCSSLANDAFCYYSYNKLVNSDSLQNKPVDAARLALISVSPAKASISTNPPNDSSAWGAIPEYINAMTVNQFVSDNNIFLQKARYAFDPRNTVVDVELARPPGVVLGALIGDSSLRDFEMWPVTGKVYYRYHLYLPVGRLIGKVGPDGHLYRTVSAEVTLL